MLNVYCGLTENIYAIEVHLTSNVYRDCHGIYIYVCGCGQDENCRLCLYEMQMRTCDCRLDWVYVTLKYDCVLVNRWVYGELMGVLTIGCTLR